MIYFDANATTKPFPEALAKMNEAYAMPFNASSTHQIGRAANKIVEDARSELQKLINAKSYEVVFTGSSTEATNMMLFGTDAEEILFSIIEHASVYNCRPENKKITEIEVLPNGTIDLADLEKKLPNHKHFLVSVMLANNETGAIQPVAEIAKLVHQKGGLIHSDIVQAVGKIDVDLEKLNVDFASISAHKINGPQGVGAFLMRKGLDIKPLILGAKQEKSRRAGTINVAGIAGFGEACKITKKKISTYDKVKELRDFLESELQKIAGDDVRIFAKDVERLQNTSYVAIRDADNQTQLINFDLNRICVSAGTACSSGTIAESRVLKAMKVEPSFSTSAIRVSLSTDNTLDEVKEFIRVWGDFYKRTKKN